MRVARVMAVVGCLAVLAAGCGGSDGDTDTAGATTTTAGSGDDGGSGDGGGSDGGSLNEFEAFLGDNGCAGLFGLYGAAFAGGYEVDNPDEYFQQVAENAPEEIADDFAVLADFIATWWGALADAGYDPNDPNSLNDPESAAAFAEAMAELQEEIDQDALDEASSNIEAWAEEECPSLAGG